MPITDWPDDERPREKLLARGPDALSDAELLAIFLRTGIPGKTAVDLARDLLVEFGSLRALLESDLQRFSQGPGSARPSMPSCRRSSKWAGGISRNHCSAAMP